MILFITKFIKDYSQVENMIRDLSKWLGLTSQQATILGLIYDLQKRKLSTRPIQIEKEYFRQAGNFIQKSNLFTQLKILQGRGILVKSKNSTYEVDIKGVQEAIFAQKKELSEEMEEITKFANDTQAFFEKVIKPSTVSVTYLTEEELYKKLTFYLRNANAYYMGCDFPHYAFSLALCNNSHEAAYIEMLSKRLDEGNFVLHCLSPYKIEGISYRLHQKYKNKELIKEELNNVCESAKNKSDKFKNLDLRKTFTPFNFGLIENSEEGDVLLMFLKNSKGLVTGGIFINSPETIKQTRQHFLSQMSTTSPLIKDEDFPDFSDEDLTSFPGAGREKLIAFDVNRIFTVNHTTVELANLVGREKEVLDFIVRQIEGTLSMQEAILESAKLLRGLSVDNISNALPHVKLTRNVKKGIKTLKDAGYYIVAISSGFTHLVKPICDDLGIDEVYCNVLEEKDGKITGEVIERNVLTDDVKYYIVKYILERLDISYKKSVGVGDGYSDIPMLKATKKRISFNPSKKMVEVFESGDGSVHHLVQEPDFMKLVEEILSQKPLLPAQ
jgi:phosphoserine phosphatase